MHCIELPTNEIGGLDFELGDRGPQRVELSTPEVPKKKKDTYLPGRVEENDKNLIQNPTTSRLLAQLTQI